MRRTIIVTGGAGFIGSNFVRTVLAQTEWQVEVIDKLTYAGNLLNLRDVESHPRYAFVHGDIMNWRMLNSLFDSSRPVAVVNFAAETHVDRSIDKPRNFLETNVVGTFELLEAARRFWARLDNTERCNFRFVHVSTDEVYGSLGKTGYFTEATPYAPNSPYAASKASSDHFVRVYHETYRMPTIITNCSNNYGPYQFPEKLIPLTILSALAGKPLPIYGDGGNVRDWLFVQDHCEALIAVVIHGRPGARYNIGGRSERTNLSVVAEVCAALDALLPTEHNPMLAGRRIASYFELKNFVPDRPGHDRRYAIDCSLIEQELHWKARMRFCDGIHLTAKWYLANRQWCQAISRAGYAGERLGLSVTAEAL
jgi:dTDP-glucose 4,6-dehydratase